MTKTKIKTKIRTKTKRVTTKALAVTRAINPVVKGRAATMSITIPTITTIITMPTTIISVAIAT